MKSTLLNKGQLAFGEHRRKGAIQENRSEQAIIKSIVTLRNQGYNYRQMAAWLDAKGFKTKNRRGFWQAASVMKVFKRGIKS